MGARRKPAVIRAHHGHRTRHRVKRRPQTPLVALLAVIFAVLGPVCCATDSVTTQHSDAAFVAGSELQTWWGQRGDVESAVEQLGGVQRCPEGVNARLDNELLEDALLTSCRQDAADFDVMELFQAGEMQVPTREQITRICLSEACAAWLVQAAQAKWLPECRYRQSQMSLRSLAEILLRIRDDLTLAGGQVVVAPNASVFQELYQINQLVNLLNEKGGRNEMDSPVMQVARQLSPQTEFESVGSGESTESVGSGESTINPSNAGSSTSPASSSNTGSSSTPSTSTPSSPSSSTSSTSSGSSSIASSSSTSGSSNSVGDDWLTSSFNATDNAGLPGSGIGPHAKSTATTTELGPSYAFLVGAWVLFNGSYFFLMRKK